MSSPTPTPSTCQSNAENDRTLVLRRFWLSTALLTATVMQVLDITIVSVALPYMAGSLAANETQISWVVTSYLVAAAISTPLTGFLTARFGRRRLRRKASSCRRRAG